MALMKSNRPRKLLIQPSANSPFCTSPSQLQEVTLDPDASNFSCVGLRSPGALSGRTVKEIDEQLSSLKKENFNLKLRIYFLEERMASNFNTGKEDVIQTNIELQIELTNLQKELENKQELLCQAAKAMEIEEDEHKQELIEKDQEISNLKETLSQLKLQFQMEQNEIKQTAYCAEAFDLNVGNTTSTETVNKLKTKIDDLQNQLKGEQERADHLGNIIEGMKNIQEESKSFESQFSEKDKQLLLMSTELEDTYNKISECVKSNDELEEQLLHKSTIIDSEKAANVQKQLELEKAKLQAEELQRLYDILIEERNELEKDANNYKLQCCVNEKRNGELSTIVESLKGKIHNLELRLGFNDREQKHEFNSTDDLFPRPEVLKKSVFTRPSSPLKPFPKSYSPQTSSAVSPKNIRQIQHNDSNETSPAGNETQLSTEEVLELKKNHFKACKIIKTMIQKKKEYVDQIDKLQNLVNEKGDEIKVLKKKISEGPGVSEETKKKSIKEKVSELNLTAGWNPSAAKEQSMAEEAVTNLTEQYKELVDELEKKVEVLYATLQEKDAQIDRFKADLQEKANRIVDLEFELLTHIQGVSNEDANEEKQDTSKSRVLAEKDEMIKKLESELRKRTGDLQGIVNHELWEKNKTIEKLHTIIKGKDETMCKMEKTNCNTKLQLNILKERIKELGIHVNMPSELISSCDIDGNVDECRKENVEDCEYLLNKLELSEKARRDTQEICTILNTRLEELCHFLQSLLKHKSILGFLGQQQSHMLHEAINKSLEFSQTLSNTILLDADQSLQQLSNITNLLNSTHNDVSFSNLTIEEDNSVLSIIPSHVTLTYHSTLSRSNNDSDVITVLRQQIANLKREVEVRDVELERVRNECTSKLEESTPTEKSFVGNSTSTTLKKQNLTTQSESESWSEPDRSVSQARIGLQDESLKRPNSNLTKRRFGGDVVLSTESSENENNYFKTPLKRSTLAESRQTIISLHDQICELEAKLAQKENQITTIQMAYYESDSLLKQEQEKLEKVTTENAELNTNLAVITKQHEERIIDVEELKLELSQLNTQMTETSRELEETKIEKWKAEQKIAYLETLVKTLEDFKRNIHLTYDSKTKHMQNTLNEMEIEKSKAIEAAKLLEKKVLETTANLERVEGELRDMYDREVIIRRELEHNFQDREASIRRELEYNSQKSYVSAVNKFEQQTAELKERYEKEYVPREDLDHSKSEISKLEQNIEELQKIICECNLKIVVLEEKVNQSLKHLDNATLQNSELVLEKTKLKNDNMSLGSKLTKACEREVELSKTLDEMQTNYKVQLLELEHQNLILESRLSSINSAQLNEKQLFSLSLPNHLNLENGVFSTYRRQISDQSGYVSEELQINQGDGPLMNALTVLDGIDDGDRLHATSPDLGIESDQGRFSSLENNSLSRPFLPSLEIAQTMNNLLDTAVNPSCLNDGCIQRREQITNENVDLRKRLLRTRRALEETLTRLTVANKQKKEVEKSICKQIHKTSQVLRKAKANLDSGSET